MTIRNDDGQPADAAALEHVLAGGPAQTWTWTGIEVTVTSEHEFWLAGQDGFLRLLAGTDAAQRAGLVWPAFSWEAVGLFSRDRLDYLTGRPGRPGHSELGACGHDPAREQLTSTYADRIHAFHRDRVRASHLRVDVHPVTQTPVSDALMQIDKHCTRVIVRA